MELPRNCSNCAHFDGEFCALPIEDKAIHGFIAEARLVVCVLWTKPDIDAPKDAA